MMKRLLVLLLVPCSYAAIARVTAVTATSAANAASVVTPTFTATVHNLLIVDAYAASNAISSVTDTAGNSFTLIGDDTTANFAYTHHSIYYAIDIIANASNAVTVVLTSSLGNGNTVSAVVVQYSGLNQTAPLDANPASGDGGPFGSPATGAFNTTAADELIIGACLFENGPAVTAGTGYTMVLNSSDNALYLEEQIVSSTQSSITATMTTIQRYSCLAASFKAQGAAPTGMVKHKVIQ